MCLLDFSDYPKHLWFYDPGNKKMIGKMKDEVGERSLMSL